MSARLQVAKRPTQTVSYTPARSTILQRKCACGGSAGVSGACEECSEQRLSRKSEPGAARAEQSAPPVVAEVLRSPGRPLDAATRSFMESRFGHRYEDVSVSRPGLAKGGLEIGPPADAHEAEAERVASGVVGGPESAGRGRPPADAPALFGDVRIHTGPRAEESARAVNARAYTVGRDIVFGAGQYAPASAEGRRLLAHELTHTLQQRQGLSLQRQEVEKKKCATTFKKATDFASLIKLVREAEAKLSACGQTDVEDRIHTLRGIFYGTEWSADYAKEKSKVRNVAFQIYTSSSTPDDPRVCLDCGLFEALQQSQDVKDPKGHVDFGHLIIGLDARRSRVGRGFPIPSQGGTGLAISTWLGDLGGGAAMLSVRRITKPTTAATAVFTGSDFGGSINLEGDVAGFVVARDKSVADAPSAPDIPSGKGVADALENYLNPPGTSAEWKGRCGNFIQMVGGTLDAKGALTNRAALIKNLAGQIEEFACWYLVNRLRQTGKLTIPTLRSASEHVTGASKEVAEVFVDALVKCQSKPSDKLSAGASAPAASPPGAVSSVCGGFIRTLEQAEAAKKKLEGAKKKLEDAKKKAGGVVKDIGKEGERMIEGTKKALEDIF